jgi:hypothetical protein
MTLKLKVEMVCTLHIIPKLMTIWNFIITTKKLILVVKTTRFCNQMALATKWVKWHGFSNSLIISRICLSWVVYSCEGKLQNSTCVVVHHRTKLMHPPSLKAFHNNQEHNLKHPGSMDLISTNKTNKLPSFIDKCFA